MKFHLAIVGAGSAGLSLAAAAARLGQKVVLFEKNEMGGECLNSGCIPSKALLAAAKAAQDQRTSARFGIESSGPVIDFSKVMEHVEGVIATIAPHDSQARFEGLGVKVVRAHARFTGRTTLAANREEYAAHRIVIATGSRPRLPDIPGLVDVPYFTNETIFRSKVLPRHLVIIGGGPIGLELAQAFRRLGSGVTVLEAATPLGSEEPETGQVVLDQLRAEGVEIRPGARVTRAEKTSGGLLLHLEAEAAVAGSHLLLAAGRVPNYEGLDLDKAGIAVDEKGIRLDRGLRSISNRHVYVAGDAAGGLQFTHVAGHHAGLVLRSALFRWPVTNRTDNIPKVMFTDPELAQVGLSERQARAVHGKAVVAYCWPFSENDRAVAECATTGLVKIVAHSGGRILGVSIVAPGAGELIAMWALAISRGLRVSAVADMVLPYPTRSEAGKRAVMARYAALADKPYVRGLIACLRKLG